MADSILPISTIIVNYNAGPSLADSVNSALYSSSEVIVIDNASTDSSLDFLTKMVTDENRLRIITNEKNLGFAAACNIGIAEAKSGYVFFLNPDCIFDQDALNSLYSALINNPQAGMVGGLLCNLDGTEQRGGRRNIPTPGKAIRDIVFNQRMQSFLKDRNSNFDLSKTPLPKGTVEVEAISGACMLCKKSTIDKVGLWDEGYFLHCEDLDWCMRFRKKGLKILFCPDAKIIHDQGGCSRTRPIFVEWHKHKGMMRFYKKHFKNSYPVILIGMVSLSVWLHFLLITMHRGIKNCHL